MYILALLNFGVFGLVILGYVVAFIQVIIQEVKDKKYIPANNGQPQKHGDEISLDDCKA